MSSSQLNLQSSSSSRRKLPSRSHLNRLAAYSFGVVLLLSTSGCSGGKFLQNTLAPDPKLKDSVAVGVPSPGTSDKSAKLEYGLPKDFPIYPQAKLQSTDKTKDRGIVTIWTTPDPIDLVYIFYQKELTAKQWQITSQPSDNSPQLVAKQAQNSLSIEPQTNTDKQTTGVTSFAISLLETTPNSSPTPSPSLTPTTSPTPSTNPTQSPIVTSSQPTENRDYLADLTQLGIFSSTDIAAKNNSPATSRSVTRREYVRWLVAAYNKINSTKSTQQIRLATADAKPAFQDIPTTHPDFPTIQGLAEAGLIPSPLSGDATTVLFRPEAPLTREQMILWKVPLDTRQPLPTASLDAVKQTWGFQDAGKVEPKALRAVLADFQNGEQSNIRRVFGYTTLFQPKKTVNLGEVAATIWYFGANSEGLSAREAK